MKELLAKLKALNAEAEDLGVKCKAETDEASKGVLQKMLDEKLVAFAAIETELKELEAKVARDKTIADVEAKSLEVESKTDELSDPPKKVDAEAKKTTERDIQAKNAFASGYLRANNGGEYVARAALEQGVMLDAMTLRDPDGKKDVKGAILAPSYMNDVIFGNMLQSKASNQPVLVADASGTLSGGGSLVPTLFVDELFRLPKLPDSIWRMCRTKTSGKDADFPRIDQATNAYGIAVSWGDEGAAITQDDPVFNIFNVNTQRLAGLTQVSLKELRNNEIGYEAYLAWGLSGAFDREVDTKILSNTVQDNRPIGINTSGQITAGVNLIARETANQISFVDLVNLQNAVDNPIYETGTFIFSVGQDSAWSYISSLDDTDGRPVMRMLDSWVASGLIPQVAGSPYVRSAANEAGLGARGDVIFGDFNMYALVVDNSPTGGVAIERSDHYAFNTGRVTFRAIGYVGGRPIGPSGFSLLGDVSAASSSSSSSS